ncbi:MAG: ABC transporter ATP-binding protein [Bauldia sp.]|nr:ABC transporter ATP-binding protein [Bauldia sp.]
MASNYVLEATGLRKQFGQLQAVKDISIQIAPGETYGLLGPNGSGKTTTISMICGLLPADGGEVLVAGMPMTTTTLEPKKIVGLVPQDLAIYPDLTARENLTFFGRLYGIPSATLKARVEEVLRVIGLLDRAGDRSGTFSGGMKRRLNIGIGLIHGPSLLVLDEPTVGVDPQSRNSILESIEKLAGAGIAVLYTTHYMEEAERLCDRVAIIDGGEIRAQGTQDELVRLVGENERIKITGSGPIAAAAERMRQIPGVAGASAADGELSVLAADAGATLTTVLQELAAQGVAIASVAVEKPDLETVFLHVTGKALRD